MLKMQERALPSHWTNAPIALECINLSDVIAAQFKVEYFKIASDATL